MNLSDISRSIVEFYHINYKQPKEITFSPEGHATLFILPEVIGIANFESKESPTLLGVPFRIVEDQNDPYKLT